MTYTIFTTPEQEAVLSWITQTFNKEHDQQLTNTEYVTQRLPQLLAPYREGYIHAVVTAVQTRFTAAPPAVQAQVIALLGGTV
jgi:hypothetical protein